MSASIRSAPSDRSRVSRAEAMAEMLETEIRRDRLKEGHRLGTKEDLRKRFGVAAATVNEALRILDIRGLVDARPGPGGGVFVAVPSQQSHHGSLGLDLEIDATMGEWLEVRMALEPVVCRDAARRRGRRDEVVLRDLIAQMRDAIDDRAKFMSLHWTLHRSIAEIGDNRPLTSVYLRLVEIVEPFTQVEVEKDPLYDPPLNLEIHEELVDAIISGSRRDLERAIRRHTPTMQAS